jgi:integrase
VADDLVAFRVASGNPSDAALIFPRADGKPWTDSDWRNWSKRKFAKAARGAGVAINRPYDLRHSAASLWLAEGKNAVQVAAWMGHSLQELSKTYAHVIADLDPDDRLSAVDMVQSARQDNPRTTLHVLTGAKQSGRRRAAAASG